MDARDHVATRLNAVKAALNEAVIPLGELAADQRLDSSIQRWAAFRLRELDRSMQNIEALLAKAEEVASAAG